MDNFFIGLVVGILGSWLFAQAVIWMTMREIRRHVDLMELMKRVEQVQDQAVVQVRIEEHQGEFFVYDIATNQFLAQGPDAAALTAAVERQADGRTVVITDGEPGVIERFRETRAKSDSA